MKTIHYRGMARATVAALSAVGAIVVAATTAAAQDTSNLLDLSIEQLSELRVTSVSRVREPLADSPASVFVITGDEIRRSGVTSIAEALRLAPGVEVARRNNYSWSITLRGFNSDLANKLLVLIDGRSVYSPLYAGVFWDVQDTLLEDVDRIEVIAGPGGTLWGANAVNGVLNIITRRAKDTAGAFVEAGGGDGERRLAAFRYGGVLGHDIAARAYVKYAGRDPSMQSDGTAAIDDYALGQAGFRMDWGAAATDRFTVQGDYYSGREAGEYTSPFTLGTLPNGTFVDNTDIAGGNVLGRWDRALGEGRDLTLQVYFDHTRRDIPATYDEARNTFDVDFQLHRSFSKRHDLLWGASFRQTGDQIGNTLFASFDPAHRIDRTLSSFLQDKIALRKRLFLTLGSKFEHNDYTGFESQPNVRLSWIIDGRRTFWSAMSRAVRIPSRLDSDLRLTLPLDIPTIPFPVYVTVSGNPQISAEKLNAYEAGYRVVATEALSFDVAVFRDDYDQLQTVEPQQPIILPDPTVPYAIVPNILEDNMHGRSVGATFSTNWEPLENVRLRFLYAFFDLDLATEPGSLDTMRPQLGGNSPRHQLSVQAFVDLPHRLSLFTAARYVDELPAQAVPSYTAVDASLRWRPRGHLDLSLTVQNLTDAHHAEFGSGGAMEIERSCLLRAAWTF
jgi:iron complex outermembrane recepter protein